MTQPLSDQGSRVPYWGPPYRLWRCITGGISYLAPEPDCPCCQLVPDERQAGDA